MNSSKKCLKYKHDGHLYRRCRFSVAEGCNLPGWLGSKISIGGYRIAQKLFKFN